VKITRALVYAINKLWLSVAVLLVTAAILLSLARLALPHADRYKADIEQWVLVQYGQPIDIGELSATWSAGGPALVLRDVSLLRPEEDQISFVLGETRAQLDFWASLLSWQLVFNDFELDGIELDIYATGDTSFDNLPIFEAIERLLFEQLTQFRVRESVIRFHETGRQRRSITIQDLSWMNRNGRRQGVGRFSIPTVTSNHLDFIVELISAANQPLAGNLYVEASRLDISPWIRQLTSSAEIERAEFNLRGWLDFENGQFTDGQVHFDENALSWRRGERTHTLITSPTTWLLTPREGGWLMNSSPLTVDLDNQRWLLDTVAWLYEDGAHLWNVSDVDIPDASPVWGLFGSPGAEISDWSEGMEPSGTLKEVKINLTAARDWRVYLQADGLGWEPFRGIPGVRGLNLEFWSERNRGRFQVSGEEVDLSSPATFATAKRLEALNWQGFWHRDPFGWTVRMPSATFDLPDAKIIQRFRIEGGQGRSTHVEWAVESGDERLNTLDALGLLPLQLGSNVSTYLDNSMRSGQVSDLRMIWRGALSEFPYRGGEGVFQASAKLNDLEFRFSPDWPTLRTALATIHYQDEELVIATEQAQLAEVSAQRMQATLSDLLSPGRVLNISANVIDEPDTMQRLFAQSPLANTVGNAMARVRGDKAVAGAFNLEIPLANPRQVRATGYAELVDQRIYIEPINTYFNRVNGRLVFDNSTLSLAAEDVRWEGLPIDIDVQGQMQEGVYELTVNGNALASAEVIANQFVNENIATQLRGDVLAQARFAMFIEENKLRYEGNVRVDLTPVASGLPEPMGKAPGEIWFWETDIFGDLDTLQLRTRVADQFQLDLRKDISQPGFESAWFTLGKSRDEVAMQAQSTMLELALTEVSLAEWQPLLTRPQQELIEESAERAVDWLPPLRGIIGGITTLNLHGYQLNDVEFDLSHIDGQWQGEVNAEQTRMAVDYAEHSDSMRFTADFFELAKPLEQQEANVSEADAVVPEGQAYWLEQLPPFEFICRICRYDDRDLGRITLGFDPRIKDGQLRHLRLLKSGTQAEFSGGWTESDGELYSRVQGSFNTANISLLLQEWGVDSVVRDASMNVSTDLTWSGGLFDVNTETLDGALRYGMQSGYLRDVDDGGARIFSVLSLDSLVRKLTLDFRDIFARGMFFNDFSGDVELVDGVVTTNNSRMLGSAGDLDVQGSTNLNTQALDYKLAYTPKVTSSLPVLLAWMVNPPSGIAALLLDRVLHDAQVISRLEYRLTGTVQSPVISEVRRDATDVEIPEEALQELERLEAEGDSEIEGGEGE